MGWAGGEKEEKVVRGNGGVVSIKNRAKGVKEIGKGSSLSD